MKTYLDLACGTGSLAFTVARMGIDVVGLDRSQEMLTMAAERLRHFKGKQTPKFIKRDMARYNLHRQFDAVGCFFDAANHIVDPEQFEQFIKMASLHTKPGGFFIFDVNTAIGLGRWDAVLFSKQDQHAVLMKGKYDRAERLAEITIHGYVRSAGGAVDRFKETFYERGYPHNDIVTLLRRYGFSKITATPQKADQTLKTALRVFYLAYKA